MAGAHRALALFFCLFAFLAMAPHAVQANPVSTDNVKAHLIAERDSVAPGSSIWVLLHFKIRDGWHTYWQNPGDSGQATQIDWQLPEGVTAGPIHWPYPHALPVGPLMNYGYEGQAFHLAEIRVPADWPADKPLQIRAAANWLVCEKTCIPENGTFELALPGGPGSHTADSATVALFEAARRDLPVESAWPARFEASGNAMSLNLDIGGVEAETIKAAHFYPYDWGVVEPAAPQSFTVDADGLTVTMTPSSAGTAQTLDGVLVLTSDTGDASVTRGLKVSATPSAPVSPIGSGAAANPVSIGIWQALLFALLGGVILNLMPCVFPVLSMKALALLQHARDERAVMRRHGLAYTAGILVCFAALALALIGLKASGAAVGWGFQLQSPVFVAILAYLLFFLGLSLSGIVTVGGSLMGMGDRLARRGGYGGSFFTGALAAIVATPCTAPFMGAAIGFALTQSAMVSLGVFLALGFGLALPYLLLTFAPASMRLLPKPGPWMERVKQVLAFPLYASVAWLVWVLSFQTGPDGVAAVLAGIVLIAFAAWIWHATAAARRPARIAGLTATVVAALLAFAPLAALPPGSAAPTAGLHAVAGKDGLPSEPYSAKRLAALRGEGRAVFVNMTAAWCITCLVNDRVALSSPKVAEAFEIGNVAYLVGDWTNRDGDVTELLESFGRNGVPLYVLYPADGGAPQVLPQILTETTVLRALRNHSTEPKTLTFGTKGSPS